MANVKVRVLDAVVDGKGPGEQLSIDEASAKALSSIGYVEVISGEVKKEVAADASAQKQAETSKPAPKKKK